jgi:hypothetical protein
MPEAVVGAAWLMLMKWAYFVTRWQEQTQGIRILERLSHQKHYGDHNRGLEPSKTIWVDLANTQNNPFSLISYGILALESHYFQFTCFSRIYLPHT